MKLREPTCHAQRLNDEIFDATGSLSAIGQDVRHIASAMLALGLSSGEDLYRMGEEISKHAAAAASAHSAYVHRQAEGTLYASLTATAKQDATK